MRRVEGVTRRVSFADLQRMPDDGNRYELFDGELRVVPSPVPIHQRLVRRLLEIVLEFTKHAGGEVFNAPFDIVLSDYDVVQPDIIYFSPATAARIRPREHVRFRPDLAIEVLSPSTARIDRGRKRELLARHGLPEYWLADYDARTLEVWLLAAPETPLVAGASRIESPRILESGTYTSSTQPGLALDVNALFAGIE
ncbi:MAG: Uma2 family endonuclease [Vicinamibacterales bacterium]